jgi:hypothetical protein
MMTGGAGMVIWAIMGVMMPGMIRVLRTSRRPGFTAGDVKDWPRTGQTFHRAG